MTGRAIVALLPFVIVLSMCASTAPTAQPAPPVPGGGPRLLVVTATAGFYHDSIPTAREVMGQIAQTQGLDVTYINTREQLQGLAPESFAAYSAVAFVNTTGELPLSPQQKAALLAYVVQGGGFLGTHSATDTFYSWPEYGALLSASFSAHPWTQRATVVVEEPSSPLTAGVTPRYDLMEEYYTFTASPRPGAQVFLTLDAPSVGAAGDYPLAWCARRGEGRVYYTALGHFAETWRDPWFQQQLRNALQWVTAAPNPDVEDTCERRSAPLTRSSASRRR